MEATKSAFITREKRVERIRQLIRETTLPKKGDKAATGEYDEKIKKLEEKLAGATKEINILRDALIQAEQEKAELWKQQQNTAIAAANAKISNAQAAAQSLWNKLQLSVFQKQQLKSNFISSQQAFAEQFAIQWTSADNTIKKERLDNEQNLKERDSLIQRLEDQNRTL